MIPSELEWNPLEPWISFQKYVPGTLKSLNPIPDPIISSLFLKIIKPRTRTTSPGFKCDKLSWSQSSTFTLLSRQYTKENTVTGHLNKIQTKCVGALPQGLEPLSLSPLDFSSYMHVSATVPSLKGPKFKWSHLELILGSEIPKHRDMTSCNEATEQSSN